jgi:hypothetical protein
MDVGSESFSCQQSSSLFDVSGDVSQTGYASALSPVAGMMGPFGRDLRSRSLVEREVIKVKWLTFRSQSFNYTGHSTIQATMRSIFILLISLVPVLSQNVAVNTTSGRLIGLQADGGMSVVNS